MANIRYEYRIEEWPISDILKIEKLLTELSEEGWELVCVVEERHYFRRELTMVIGG